MKQINPNKLRKLVLDMVYNAKSGHIGGCFSIAETIAVLYSNYDIGGKDKLILSKGHAVPIIYAALNELGKISDEELKTFRQINSRLQGHPDKVRLPLVDATTGSLGQGLSIAIGHALAKKLKNEDGTVFCILGDGELQEGQVWEALMYYPWTLGLKNLVCLIDWNKCQNDGKTYETNYFLYHGLQEKLEEFGWCCETIKGHDMEQINDRLQNYDQLHPKCLILDTIKGCGVSFMQNTAWHCKVPTEQEYNDALAELGF